jgi:hypothetical protein
MLANTGETILALLLRDSFAECISFGLLLLCALAASNGRAMHATVRCVRKVQNESAGLPLLQPLPGKPMQQCCNRWIVVER